MKTGIPVGISIALVTALICLILLPPPNLPDRCALISSILFVAAGIHARGLKVVHPSMFAGALYAALFVLFTAHAAPAVGSHAALVASFFIPFFILTYSFGISIRNNRAAECICCTALSVPSIESIYPASGETSNNIVMKHSIGLITGWLPAPRTFSGSNRQIPGGWERTACAVAEIEG